MRINIAISGGPCTGKSTLAGMLFAQLKTLGFDYDLITEEIRRLKKEMGQYRSPFERLYTWLQQEREELRSVARDGFVTDTPLFHLYTQARRYQAEPRDKLAVRELFRMCMGIEDRYQLIVLPEDPFEIVYKTDQVRCADEEQARRSHRLIQTFVEHFWEEKVVYVRGEASARTEQVIKALAAMRKGEG